MVTVTSWVESANDPASDFPIQNLPFGVFRRKGAREAPRGGVAIGDQVFDLAALGLNTGPNLNKLAAAGRPAWRQLRRVLTLALSDPRKAKRFSKHLVPMKKAELFLPVQVGDYSDFYAGIRAGDVLLQLGNQDIVDPGSLRRHEAAMKPGTKVKIVAE